MKSLLAKNNPLDTYEPRSQEEETRAQQIISLSFWAGEYKITRGAGRDRQVVETGRVAPEVAGDGREARAVRKTWIAELDERVRAIAEAEGLCYHSQVSKKKDYR